MMDTKLWIALCALLLVNLGSAEHDDDHAAASSSSESGPGGEVAPETPAVPSSILNPTPHVPTAPSLNGSEPSSTDSSSLSNSTTTEGETIAVTPVPTKVNDTSISTSEAFVPEDNGNPSDQSTSQPPIPPSSGQDPTSHTSPTITTATLIHTTHPTTVDKPTPMPTTKTIHHTVLPDSVTPSNDSPNTTHSSISVPTPQPPTSETTPATTIVITQSSSISSTSSSQKPASSESTTLSSPQSTLQSDEHPKASNKSTINPPTSPAVQTKAHADTPSQLNVGGGPTMVHDGSPTLDPLLAGLVSAFIITAVIITLLLFLKLRRRDNRPEFRRLQDLPMDDMMEDTPLSMYSY